MLFRTLAGLSLVAALASCSSAYGVRAVAIGGKLAFVPADTGVWAEPECIYSIMVSSDGGQTAVPSPADDARMVANGIYWNKNFDTTSCDNPFPVFYGATLKGPPFYKNRKAFNVEAKRLRRGVVYQVNTSSRGSAYGSGKFIITNEKKIVNLPV